VAVVAGVGDLFVLKSVFQFLALLTHLAFFEIIKGQGQNQAFSRFLFSLSPTKHCMTMQVAKTIAKILLLP